MTIAFGELKKGLPIELDSEPYIVVEYKSHKMQQRAPVMQVRFRSLRTGKVVDKSFQGYDVKFTPAAIERKKAQYIYQDDDLYYFMDNDTFDQFPMSSDQIANSLNFMVEQTEVELIFYEDNPISLELPITVDLEVSDSPPGVKGDTATGATKLATLETGLELQVPLFVNQGDTIKVDTRTGTYISRT